MEDEVKKEIPSDCYPGEKGQPVSMAHGSSPLLSSRVARPLSSWHLLGTSFDGLIE
jgi:hypothetical protein